MRNYFLCQVIYVGSTHKLFPSKAVNLKNFFKSFTAVKAKKHMRSKKRKDFNMSVNMRSCMYRVCKGKTN